MGRGEGETRTAKLMIKYGAMATMLTDYLINCSSINMFVVCMQLGTFLLHNILLNLQFEEIGLFKSKWLLLLVNVKILSRFNIITKYRVDKLLTFVTLPRKNSNCAKTGLLSKC